MDIRQLRQRYHKDLCEQLLGLRSGVPNNADRGSKTSVALANGLFRQLCNSQGATPPREQTAGRVFGELTNDFLRDAFSLLSHVALGEWEFSTSQGRIGIAAFDQYEHLAALQEAVRKLPKKLAAALGGDYLITPDIIISKKPLADDQLNAGASVIAKGHAVAGHTPRRLANTSVSTLHASVSCKWTIRSDRAQNTRTEALNLIRNRKGNTPHIVAVTAEPMPTRLASLALGTGDIDCVYHIALPELRRATRNSGNADQAEVLRTLVDGRRLRDIADLPFDLAI